MPSAMSMCSKELLKQIAGMICEMMFIVFVWMGNLLTVVFIYSCGITRVLIKSSRSTSRVIFFMSTYFFKQRMPVVLDVANVEMQ